MVRLLAERFAFGLLTLLVISLIVFVGTEILPGDVVEAVLGQGAREVDVAAIRRQLGLDRPAPERYLQWLTALITGDLGGRSIASGRAIADIVSERLPQTLALASATAAVAVPLSLCLGLIAALRPGSWIDRGITTATVVLLSAPEFLLGTVLVIFFAVRLRWLPAVSYASEPTVFFDHFRSMALPVMTLTAAVIAPMTRMTRSAMLSVLASPAIEMAVLKGLSRSRIILRHAFKNALPPIITVIALNLGYLVTGVVVVEVIFNYPGLAKVLAEAVGARDIPVVQTCAMIFCSAYVVLNLAADMLALAANPRRRYPK